MKTVLSMFLAVACIFTFAMAEAAETLTGAGATFPEPVYKAWALAYYKATGIEINYQGIGSGGGIRQITTRTVDFGASDAPLTPEQLKKDGLYQFPAVIGGVVLVVNLPGVKAGQMILDSEVISKIYLGEIKFWDDAHVKALNPGMNLPHAQINVVHRSDGSGTTAIFTRYLSGQSAEWKTKVGTDTSVNWPVGIGGKGNPGVANYVKQAPNSIGYVELQYAKAENLAYTMLKDKGKVMAPTTEAFKEAATAADFEPSKDFDLWLVNSPKGWPIAGATFILLAKDKKDSSMKTVKFYDWAFKNGDKTVEQLFYVPLPEKLKNKIRAYWKQHGVD